MASYSTGFDTTEDPLSEGGALIAGPGAYNNCQAASSNLRPSAINSNSAFYLNSPSIGADQYSQGTYAAATVTQFFGLYVRMASSTDADGYRAQCNTSTGDVTIGRRTDTGTLSTTALGSAYTSTGLAENKVLRLEVSGSTFTLKIDGVQFGTTRSDSTYSSGQPGADCFSSSTAHNALKDWEGGDLAAAAADSFDPFGMMGFFGI